MNTSRRTPYRPSRLLMPGLALFLGGAGVALPDSGGTQSGTPADAAAAGTAAADAPKTLPQSGVFSSFKQALKQGYDHEAVRGYFDLGTPPTERRYYCLVDLKTGEREPNGVLGPTMPLAGGMTGVKVDSVSLYRCADAEQQGMLVTAGFVVTIASRAAKSPAAAASAPAPSPPETPAQTPAPIAATPAPIAATPAPAAATPAPAAASPAGVPMAGDGVGGIDVAGLKLGMSLDEVRAVLKSKKLREYRESAETLGYLDSARGAMQAIANGRFVNVIAAWTAPPNAAADAFQTDGESYEVMFTPVPGKERAMAIVHSVGYSSSNAIRETVLESALAKKYGGYAASNDLPQSPTWRFQAGGKVEVGDPCNRRGTFGGLSGLSANSPRENLALKSTLDEFRFQIDRCGAAIVTEDHFTSNGGALRDERLVTRFTVTAYSPSLGLEGAQSATQLIRAGGSGAGRPEASRTKEQSTPNL